MRVKQRSTNNRRILRVTVVPKPVMLESSWVWVFWGGAMTKMGSGGFGTTLILALLLVLVSVASGAGIAYLI